MAPLRKHLAVLAFWLSSTSFFARAEEVAEEVAGGEDEEDDTPTNQPAEPEKEPEEPRPDHWNDTPDTTTLWKLVSKDSGEPDEALEVFLEKNPTMATSRSKDGRGGLFWAWEYKNAHALAALKMHGADPMIDEDEWKDKTGHVPFQMCKSGDEELEELDDKKLAAADPKSISEECKNLLEGIDTKIIELKENSKIRKEKAEKAAEIDDEDEEEDKDDDEAVSPPAKADQGADEEDL